MFPCYTVTHYVFHKNASYYYFTASVTAVLQSVENLFNLLRDLLFVTILLKSHLVHPHTLSFPHAKFLNSYYF